MQDFIDALKQKKLKKLRSMQYILIVEWGNICEKGDILG